MPNFLKGGPPALTLIALRLSGATAIAALIALVGVSLPAVLQRSGNDSIHTTRLPNPADVQQQDQSPIAAAPPSLNERRTQENEPPPDGGSVERQFGIATVRTDSVTNAIDLLPLHCPQSHSQSGLERGQTMRRLPP